MDQNLHRPPPIPVKFHRRRKVHEDREARRSVLKGCEPRARPPPLTDDARDLANGPAIRGGCKVRPPVEAVQDFGLEPQDQRLCAAVMMMVDGANGHVNDVVVPDDGPKHGVVPEGHDLEFRPLAASFVGVDTAGAPTGQPNLLEGFGGQPRFRISARCRFHDFLPLVIPPQPEFLRMGPSAPPALRMHVREIVLPNERSVELPPPPLVIFVVQRPVVRHLGQARAQGGGPREVPSEYRGPGWQVVPRVPRAQVHGHRPGPQRPPNLLGDVIVLDAVLERQVEQVPGHDGVLVPQVDAVGRIGVPKARGEGIDPEVRDDALHPSLPAALAPAVPRHERRTLDGDVEVDRVGLDVVLVPRVVRERNLRSERCGRVVMIAFVIVGPDAKRGVIVRPFHRERHPPIRAAKLEISDDPELGGAAVIPAGDVAFHLPFPRPWI
mmetsp:Transcript_19626/g.39779  ORF Transcript_19626/g.39779 Transcript_19626/m.39779 type:complete len:438 (+) Transcript_19626:855-2168(+)